MDLKKTGRMCVGKLCLICKQNPSAYKSVRHCKKCHSKYNKENYKKHKSGKDEKN